MEQINHDLQQHIDHPDAKLTLHGDFVRDRYTINNCSTDPKRGICGLVVQNQAHTRQHELDHSRNLSSPNDLDHDLSDDLSEVYVCCYCRNQPYSVE